jgi:GNAT superfamily N-acetyltransferase
MRIRPSSDEVEAFVLDVDVLPELRGHGWGRATMLAAEQAARDAGASVLRLSVVRAQLGRACGSTRAWSTAWSARR